MAIAAAVTQIHNTGIGPIWRKRNFLQFDTLRKSKNSSPSENLRIQKGMQPISLSRLLVEDVDGHDAEGVVVLDGAGGAVRVERALGHLREDHVERVGAALIHRGHDVLKMP